MKGENQPVWEVIPAIKREATLSTAVFVSKEAAQNICEKRKLNTTLAAASWLKAKVPTDV